MNTFTKVSASALLTVLFAGAVSTPAHAAEVFGSAQATSGTIETVTVVASRLPPMETVVVTASRLPPIETVVVEATRLPIETVVVAATRLPSGPVTVASR
jgi:hypothetical protein